MRYRKYLPTREQLRNTRSLQFLGHIIFEPNLWHFNRHSVSFAVLIGIFCCFLPMPFQMIPCVLLVIWVRCNIPLAIAIVWISNPITMPPMMYFSYKLGRWMLGQPAPSAELEVSTQWLVEQLAVVWQPLLLGCIVTGTTLGLLGFALVRLYWRWKVARDWRKRKRRLEKYLANKP
ncbi:MAG: DUF2062 domain-containing protein [Pseudomonadales bacterium]|jgi:uncharacterized protein (DUF2062 family)|tara:strand:+ start:9354 stop:9881 length:528 start_codon:yes stop_codon:yes gene_type:complete